MIIRLFVALSIITAPLAAKAGGIDKVSPHPDEFPAIALTLTGENSQGMIVTAPIPKENEAAFLHGQLLDRSGQPMTIVYSNEDGPIADELDKAREGHSELSLIKLSDQDMAKVHEAEKRLPITLQNMKDVSLVVVLANLGILAGPLYMTSTTKWGFLAAFFFIGIQVIANDRYRVITNYITGASKRFKAGAQKIFPSPPITGYIDWASRVSPPEEKWTLLENEFAGTVGSTTGRIGSALLYSFISNSFLKYFMYGFDFNHSLGSPAGRADIETSVGTGFFTGSVWDIKFADRRRKADVEADKITQLLVWGKTTFLFTMAAPMLYRPTKPVALGIMAAFGVLGLYFHHNEGPFVRLGRFVLDKIETEEKYTRIFYQAMDLQKKMVDALTPSARFRSQCNAIRAKLKRSSGVETALGTNN